MTKSRSTRLLFAPLLASIWIVGQPCPATRAGEVKSCREMSESDRAQIGFQCETIPGIFFKRVAFLHFGLGWQAHDGRVWGDVLSQPPVDNLDFLGTPPAGQQIRASRAVALCKAIGANLPTQPDFEILKDYFSHNWMGSFLDKNGEQTVKKLFPALGKLESQKPGSQGVWSSTTFPKTASIAYVFKLPDGNTQAGQFRNQPLHVMCVKN